MDTLCKYLDNLLSDPGEEKFRKIRKSNRVFQEKVAACEGHDLFLEAVGFETQDIDGQVRRGGKKTSVVEVSRLERKLLKKK